MPEEGSLAPVPGTYVESAPAFDAEQYGSLEEFKAAVSSLVFDSDGDVGWNHNEVANDWYDFEADRHSAMMAIEDANNAFAKKIEAVGEHLTGAAGDAVQQYAKSVLEESVDLWRTLSHHNLPKLVGDNGHTIRAFVGEYHSARYEFANWLENAQKDNSQFHKIAMYLAAEVPAMPAIAELRTSAIEKNDELRKKHDQLLLPALQQLLNGVSRQSTERGAELRALYPNLPTSSTSPAVYDSATEDLGDAPTRPSATCPSPATTRPGSRRSSMRGTRSTRLSRASVEPTCSVVLRNFGSPAAGRTAGTNPDRAATSWPATTSGPATRPSSTRGTVMPDVPGREFSNRANMLASPQTAAVPPSFQPMSPQIQPGMDGVMAGVGGSGMPMSSMGMGGAPGGGQQNQEREPAIWLQADGGAWDDGAPASSVLGRS